MQNRPMIALPKTAALAPMAGVTDRAFREICREFHAAYVVSEMASAKGMTYANRRTGELLELSEAERPAGVQLFGSDPQVMAQGAKLAMTHQPDVIDINMGCPAPKVAGNGGGSALMRDPKLAGEIMRAVVQAVPVPVTVKIRKGWDDSHVNAVEIAKIAEDAGISAITVHGRTRAQMYAPGVDLEIIAAVKEAVAIPVIGNGDVDSVESAIHMYEQTGCDLVMVGRGALGSPWLFEDLHLWFTQGRRLPPLTLPQRMEVMLRQIQRAIQYKGEYTAMREARKHAGWYLKGMRGAAALRAQAGTLKTFDDLRRLADRAIQENPGA